MKDLEFMSNNQLRELQTKIDTLIFSRLQGKLPVQQLKLTRKNFGSMSVLRQAEVVSLHYARLANYAVATGSAIISSAPEIQPMSERFLEDSAWYFITDFGCIPPWGRVDRALTNKANAS